MPGKNPRLTPLELRKQLLLAESELNRAHMAGDLTAIASGVGAITERVKSFESIASSAAALVTGLAAFRRVKSTETGAKPSWLQTILKGASLLSTLWLAFRPAGRTRKEI